jgi:hypothetical protein
MCCRLTTQAFSDEHLGAKRRPSLLFVHHGVSVTRARFLQKINNLISENILYPARRCLTKSSTPALRRAFSMPTYPGMSRSPTPYARLIAITKRNLARATEPALRAKLQQTINGLEARRSLVARIDRRARGQTRGASD